ncbi:MAG: 4-hydroxy-3-methylbut-2-enyl diphosphate reductase [Oscillospiraceae bacterium]|jgi:4-hydroxy-3-methylbut-2-enyl diphosphate reductase|nr:4-hydroxy-3-methylbut-2-enyl diphosphate reductase [Oscillospiraceae bacterium]
MPEIEVVPSAGYCYGVARAVKLAEGAAPCYTLGPLIHNRRAVEGLEAAGVRVAGSADELPGGAVALIRCHGAPPEVYAAIERRGVTLIDATCPDVKKIHDLVKAESDSGRLVLLFGDPEHPEVKATAAWCRRCAVFSSAAELKALWERGAFHPSEPLTMAAQTTSKPADYEKCRDFLKKECTNVKILDTICGTTVRRQLHTAELSRRVDVMVVVGDRASANTRHLAAVCECPVVFVEGGGGSLRTIFGPGFGKERDQDPFPAGVGRIGVTAGASTPFSIIEEVVSQMSEEMNNPLAQETESEATFAELLEPTLRPLHTGDKITGIITGILPTEIQVDLGSKHAAYIPLSELTDDPAADAGELVKIGDEIETYIMRVNDVEGTVMLSKRRLDTVKSWEDVESAQETRAVMEGVVVEENKGGVVVSVKGVRVFVPASQTGLPRDVPMSTLLKTKVRLRVTEFHRSKRRVVGSIRSVAQEDRRAKAEAVWENVEVGRQYKGIVKSLTAYGAFVDIGGVDGLVHLSELSWQRLRAPSDMLKVGDELDVTVIGVDREKHRISLRHRKQEDNPWLKFVDTHKAGDIVRVTVNKLMPFGAFAEVMPGVDGLIHISQLTDRRIAKPSEAVSEGDTLDVKITDIDLIRRKISLSARALAEVEPEAQREEGPDEIVAIAEGGEAPLVSPEYTEDSEESPVPPAEDELKEDGLKEDESTEENAEE